MKRGRRILYLLNAPGNDAPTSLTLSVAAEMARNGWDVCIVFWKPGDAQGCDSGFPQAHYLPQRGMIGKAARLAAIVRSFHPGIVHTALVRPAIGLTLARLLGLRKTFRWVAADHGIHEWYEKGSIVGGAMSGFMPAILSNAEKVVTVSQAASSNLVRKGVPQGQVVAISNGVDVRKFFPRGRAGRRHLIQKLFPQAGEDDRLIGSAGNLRLVKGHDILIRAMALVVEQLPSARLVLYGTGPQELELQALVDHLNLRDHVKLAGYEKEMQLIYPIFDVYVQPSRMESFGLAAAEAMACGTPTIVARTGGLRELSCSGKYAPEFDPEDVSGLSNVLLEVLQDPYHRRELGEQGRLRVLQEFSSHRMFGDYDKLYRKLTGPHDE